MIAEHHLAMLANSGITPEHAEARGYETISDPRRLVVLGIAKAGQRTRGLLVPQLRADRSTWGYQYRPDSPRERNGKVVKYETPIGQRNGIDVPPGVGPLLGDPTVPLFITEGVKKADCGALHGLCIVAIPGVWSWRGRNTAGGKTAVPDFHDIALNDRRLILAFDGDVARKTAVHDALSALAGYLASKGARVEYLHLPDTDDKTGLDDYLMEHTVEDLWRLVKPTKPPVAATKKDEPEQEPMSAGSAGSAGLSGSDTREVLNRSRNWLERFICPMDPRDLDLLTLWIAHTHLVNETYTTPRLLIESPVPESGKTTVLEHLERFCAQPIQMATVSSPAMITRVLDNGVHTLLIDEADRSLSPDKPGIDDLIAVLNSGYKKGATRPVLVPVKGGGWDTAMMPTFAPVAMAGNQPKLPDDTLSRVIRMLIMPDHDGTVEDSDWEMIEDEAQEIAAQLVLWANEVREQVRAGERPTLPEGAKARTKERWLPLKRVAVAAGGRWPQVVDQLVELDLERMKLDREEGILNEKPHVVLLRHVAEVWPEGETFLTTDDIISKLTARFPTSWRASDRYPKGLTAQRFGRMLVKNYGVYSSRPDTHGSRGYVASSLSRALRSVRMPPLASEPDKPAEPAEPDEPGIDPDAQFTWSAEFGHGPKVDRESVSECACGNQMVSEASISRGYCQRCHFAAKRAAS